MSQPIFSESGHVIDPRVHEAMDKIDKTVHGILAELYKDGITMVEARAVEAVLISSAENAATFSVIAEATRRKHV